MQCLKKWLFRQLLLIDMCGIFPAFNQSHGFVMHAILMNFSFSEAEAIKQKLVRLKVMVNIQSPGLIRTPKFPPFKILPPATKSSTMQLPFTKLLTHM